MAFSARQVFPDVWHIADCMGVCMTLLVGFLIGFDSKHWELIVTLLGWVALAALFAYFIRGGDLFRWEVAPTSDDGAYFEDNADVSQCKNQSVGRKDA